MRLSSQMNLFLRMHRLLLCLKWGRFVVRRVFYDFIFLSIIFLLLKFDEMYKSLGLDQARLELSLQALWFINLIKHLPNFHFKFIQFNLSADILFVVSFLSLKNRYSVPDLNCCCGLVFYLS